MSNISINHGLPFITVTLRANNQQLRVDNVLLDTGSAASVFKTDDLESIGVFVAATDRVRFMHGIGGREAVVEKTIEGLEIGNLTVSSFSIQLGALDYGFELNGILGMDFLRLSGAIVNLRTLVIEGSSL